MQTTLNLGVSAVGTRIPLIPAYPGRKKNYFDLICGDRPWPSLIEPFVGSGITALRLGARETAIADVGDCYQIWKAWADGHWPDVRDQVQRWQTAIALRSTPTPKELPLWAEIKHYYSNGVPSSTAAIAAAWLLRAVSYGNMARTNKAGEWNVPLDNDKIRSFLSKPVPLPPPLQGRWQVGHGWDDCLSLYQDRGTDLSALALVDPPYFFPLSEMPQGLRMTGTYPGHDPHDPELLEMAGRCIRNLSALPSVKRIVAFNYWSAPMGQMIEEIAQCHGRSLGYNPVGHLRSLSRRGQVNQSTAVEYSWILGEKR